MKATQLLLALLLSLSSFARSVDIDGAGPIKTGAPVINPVGPVTQPALNAPLAPVIPNAPELAAPELDQAVPALPQVPILPAAPNRSIEGTPGAEAIIPQAELPKPLADIQPMASHDWLSAPWENLSDLESAVFDGAGPHARGSAKTKPAPKAKDDEEAAGDEDEPARSPTADDGGGADYPHRFVRFIGEKFRSVLFRPNVPVEDDIVRAINAARKSVHIALYEFKQTAVLNALRQARERGVQVHIVIDYKQMFPEAEAADPDNPDAPRYKAKRSKEIWALAREGFNVKVLKGLGDFGINHNKFAVIDHGENYSLGIFGSYNWTWTAEDEHYENANFTTDKKRVGALKTYWDWLNTLAEPVVYNHKNGTVDLANPDRVWPTGVLNPPSGAIPTLNFYGTKLPIMVLSPTRKPGEDIESRLVQAIEATAKLKDEKKRTIDISIFALRSTKIVSALVAAHKAGAAVRVIIDQRQATDKETEKVFGIYAQYLAFHGVQVKTLSGPDPEGGYALAQKNHSKFAIFAGELVETGSANYTKYAAVGNFENAHFLDDATDVAGYSFVFEHAWKKATALPAPAREPAIPTDAQLLAEVDKPTAPASPSTPETDPDAMKTRPRDIAFNGEILPSHAFRPETPIELLLIKAIKASRKSIRLGLYEFTLEGVLDALRDAKKRGLKIEIVLDRSHVYTTGKDHTGQARKPSPEVMALLDEGFDVKILKGERNGIQHNKYGLFDAEDIESGGGLVVFGSYNWASTAEHNHFENVLFRNGKELAADGAEHGKIRLRNYLNYFNYQRGLAEEVDRDTLAEVLSTGKDAKAEAEAAEQAMPEEAEPEAAAKDGVRRSKMPPPPEDPSTPVDLNGEKFRLEYYSPQGGVLDAWLRAIKAAKSSIEIGMFGFYSREAAEAIVQAIADAKAQNRALRVRLVLDAAQSMNAKFDKVPVAQWFAERGVDVHQLAGPNADRDPMFEKQHSKFILIDDKFLMTGSFNLSGAAESFNFENENVVVDPTDVAAFVEWFERLYQRGWAPRERRPAKGKAGGLPGAKDPAGRNRHANPAAA